jgi:predicted double-glycine peptidase
MKLKNFISEKSTIIDGFPNIRQAKSFSCGAAALQSILNYYGFDEKEEDLIKELKTDKTGTLLKYIKKALTKRKLKFEEKEMMKINDLMSLLRKKIPVILMIQAWGKKENYDGWEDGHFVVAIGYDNKSIIFDDPSLSKVRGFIKFEDLMKRWHDIDDGEEDKKVRYGLAVFGKDNSMEKKEIK